MGLFNKRRNVRPLFVGSNGNDLTRGIYAFHLDIDNGEILKKEFYESPSNPAALCRRERYAFVCYKNRTGRMTDGGLHQYAQMDLQFGLAAKATDEGKTYVAAFVNEKRKNAYAVDYYNGEVVMIPIVKQKITKVAQTLKHEGHGLDERYQAKPHPTSIDETPEGHYMVVTDLGTDEVVLYTILEDGFLERNDELTFKVTPGSGPKKVVFSRDAKFAYVLNELSSTVCVYQYDDGAFTFVQEIDTYPKDEEDVKNRATDIIVSADYLFVANAGHDSVSTLEMNKETGELKFIEYMETDENPVCMVLVHEKWVVVASQKGGTLESFEIKKGEYRGVLFETHYVYSITEPVCMIEGRPL